LHLGHYVGSLANRVRLQDEYETILIIADLHTLTTKNEKADIEHIADNARGMVLDYLGAGIDPRRLPFTCNRPSRKSTELNTLFENLVTVNRLSRFPV